LPDWQEQPQPEAELTTTAKADEPVALTSTLKPLRYYAIGVFALLCLSACLLLPIWVFWGPTESYEDRVAVFNRVILWVTLAYFASGVIWMGEWEKRKSRPSGG
jgi:hypothetical protein